MEKIAISNRLAMHFARILENFVSDRYLLLICWHWEKQCQGTYWMWNLLWNIAFSWHSLKHGGDGCGLISQWEQWSIYKRRQMRVLETSL